MEINLSNLKSNKKKTCTIDFFFQKIKSVNAIVKSVEEFSSMF